jgi:nucleotide-binding universal stress UspA family protein
MMPEIKKILYATDLSKNAAYAFRYAVYLAKISQAEIVILHVVEKMSNEAQLTFLAYFDKSERLKMSKERVEKAIARIRKRLAIFCERELANESCPSPKETTIEVIEGYPAEEILRQLEEQGCDAIVMGTHEKGLSHTFLGSVTKRVLRRSRKPTFVVPLPGGETDFSIEDD